MKNKILIILASLLASAAFASAHCGQCATDKTTCDTCEETHAAHHESCADGLLGHYFETQQALAGDDLNATKTAAKEWMAEYKNSACGEERKACCLAIHNATQSIIEAPSIQEARTAFKKVSDTLISLVKNSGLAHHETYLAYCPMAFANTGASWLQQGKAIANPYFGASMYSCGVIQDDFTRQGHESHGEHKH